MPMGVQTGWAMPSGVPWEPEMAMAKDLVSVTDAETAKATGSDLAMAPAVVTVTVSGWESVSESVLVPALASV